MKITRLGAIGAIALAGAFALSSCAANEGGTGGETPSTLSGTLNGAGSSAQGSAQEAWVAAFQTANPGVTINYDPAGSGAGREQFIAGGVDWAGSDSALNDDELASTFAACAPDTKAIDIPTYISPIAVIFNVEGVTDLNLDAETIAHIFKGDITKWNDPAIAAVNPGVTLPNTDIVVVHRSEGSGTTYIFADYLAKVSPEWKAKVGVNNQLSWPAGVGAKGSDGVTGQVKATPGAIGYAELTYALTNKLGYGSVENRAKKFVKASTESVTAAASAAAKQMPADFRVSITNADGDAAYPISSFTWLLLYENPADKAQSKAMVDFMKWALKEGQKFAPDMGYAPLPQAVVDLELKALERIKTQ